MFTLLLALCGVDYIEVEIDFVARLEPTITAEIRDDGSVYAYSYNNPIETGELKPFQNTLVAGGSKWTFLASF